MTSTTNADALLKQSSAIKQVNTAGYTPVKTLNGWTLPFKMNNGVKEFHLVAEEIEHDLAPRDFNDPGWFKAPKNTTAKRVSQDPNFGAPIRYKV